MSAVAVALVVIAQQRLNLSLLVRISLLLLARAGQAEQIRLEQMAQTLYLAQSLLLAVAVAAGQLHQEIGREDQVAQAVAAVAGMFQTPPVDLVTHQV